MCFVKLCQLMERCAKMIECGERERELKTQSHQLHSSSASTHLLLKRWDADPETSTSCLGDRSSQHGSLHHRAVSGKLEEDPQLRSIYDYLLFG